MIPLIPLLIAASNIAPILTKFLGMGDATQKVAEKVADVATAITGITDPQEAIKKVQEDPAARSQFLLQVNAQYMTWDKMFLEDTQNARDRDVKLQTAGFRNNRANALTAFAASMICIILAIIIFKTSMDEWVKGVLLVYVGRLWGYLDQIFSFEFGTTKHSAAKDLTIADLTKQVGDK